MKQHSPPPLSGRTSPGFILTTLLAWFIWASLPAHAGDPPVIVQQPKSIMVPIGDTLRLSCVVTGTPPIALIWQRDGAFLGDQTNAMLTITNAQSAHSGRYRLTASNDDGLVRSTNADVIVYTNQPCNFFPTWLQSPGASRFSWATGLALDRDGNAYVTGTIYTHTHTPDTVEDWLTVKFSPTGTILWQARFNGPRTDSDWARDIALDANGNCFVTGSTWQIKNPSGNGDDDYLTIKYGTNGAALWMAAYGGTASDGAYGVAADSVGCAYVTGNSGTLKYSPAGQPIWTNGFAGNRIKMAPAGDAILLSNGSTVTKLTLDGEALWQNSVGDVRALALDTNGNAYVTAATGEPWPSSQRDIRTIKFSPSGETLWSADYDSSYHSIDEAYGGLAIGAQGEVVVAGYSYWGNPQTAQQAGRIDAVVLNYQADGSLAWGRHYTPGTNQAVYASAVTTDTEGSVYAAVDAEFVPGGNTVDALLLKYDRAGNLLWTSRYHTPSQRPSVAGWRHLALASGGRLIAAGSCGFVSLNSEVTQSFLVADFNQTVPRLAMAGVPAPGVRQGCLVSPRQSVFDILGATNLSGVAWQSIGTVTNFNGLVPFYDRDAGQHPMRFYRAQEVSP